MSDSRWQSVQQAMDEYNRTHPETPMNRWAIPQAIRRGTLPARKVQVANRLSQGRVGPSWEVDTASPAYQRWLEARQYQPRVVGRVRSRYFLVRYEVTLNGETIDDEVMVEAYSASQVREGMREVAQEKYGQEAVLMSVDISPDETADQQQSQRS